MATPAPLPRPRRPGGDTAAGRNTAAGPRIARRTLLGGGLAALGAGLAGCADDAVGHTVALPAGADIVIGACLELTGANAVAGTSAQRGIQVALDEINALGLRVGGKSRKIRLVVRDNKSDPDTAAAVTTELITSGQVSALIGGAVAVTSTVMSPIAEQHQVPMLSLASADSIVKPVPQHRFVFKLGPDAGRVADLMVQHMAANGITKIGVLAETGAHGDAGLAALADSGRLVTVAGTGRQATVQIGAHARLPLGAADYHAQAKQMVDSGVRVVVIWSQAPVALLAARALYEANYIGSLYFDTGAVADDATDVQNNQFINGSLFVAPLIMSPDGPIGNNTMSLARETYFDDFTRRYGAVSAYAIFGADALRLLGTAIERSVDPTRLRIRNGLEAAPIYQLAGSYMFSTINHGGVLPDQLSLLRISAAGWTRI